MIGQNLPLEKRIERAHVRFMRHEKFARLSGIITLGKTEVTDDPIGNGIFTAGTDGWDTKYNRDWCDQWDDKELAFIVLHENFHKALRHTEVWLHLYKENPRLAGQACDHVINLKIVEMDPHEDMVAFPRVRDKDGKKTERRCGCYDERFVGMDAGQIFRILKKEEEEGEEEGDSPEGEEEGGEGGESKGKKESDKQGEGKDKFTQESIDEHSAREKDDQGNTVTETQKREMAHKIDEALRQGAILAKKLAGQGSGNVDRSIDELLEPKVDWKDVMDEFVTSSCAGKEMSSWRKLNKRYQSMGINLPIMIANAAGHIITGIDTSGSVPSELLKEFVSEGKGICEAINPEMYTMLYWDSVVENAETYVGGERNDFEKKTRPRGGGGTDPNAVCNWIRENIKDLSSVNCVVIMTDGYVPGWGDWTNLEHIPVLWLIVGDSDAKPTRGIVVNIRV